MFSKWLWLLLVFSGPSPLPSQLTQQGIPVRPGDIALSREKLVKWNTWVLLSHFHTKSHFNGSWEWVALSYWILDWSGRGMLSGFLFWSRSGEWKHCEGMIIKAWGKRDAGNYLQNYLYPILKKKPVKILQLYCQERRGLRRGFPSREARAARQSLASPLGRTAPLVTTPRRARAEGFCLSVQQQVALSVLHLQQILQGSCIITMWSDWEFQSWLHLLMLLAATALMPGRSGPFKKPVSHEYKVRQSSDEFSPPEHIMSVPMSLSLNYEHTLMCSLLKFMWASKLTQSGTMMARVENLF